MVREEKSERNKHGVFCYNGFSKNINKLIALVGILIVVVFLVLMIDVGFILFLNHQVSEPSVEKNEFYEYRFLHVNFEKNSQSTGTITKKNPLGELNGYISYRSDEENYYLVSNFEDQEYVCRGTCFCENERKTLSSSIPLPKSLIYLVAAVSSYIALDLARDHFKEECNIMMGNSCDKKSSINANFEECEVIGDITLDGPGWNPSDTDPKYWCKGHCMYFESMTVHLDFDDEDEKEKFIQEKREWCESLKLEMEVILIPGAKTLEIEMLEATEYFRLSSLRNYCNDQSMLKKKDTQEFMYPEFHGKKVFKSHRFNWCENGAVMPDRSLKYPKIDCKKIN